MYEWINYDDIECLSACTHLILLIFNKFRHASELEKKQKQQRQQHHVFIQCELSWAEHCVNERLTNNKKKNFKKNSEFASEWDTNHGTMSYIGEIWAECKDDGLRRSSELQKKSEKDWSVTRIGVSNMPCWLLAKQQRNKSNRRLFYRSADWKVHHNFKS